MKVDRMHTGIEDFEDLSPGDIFTLGGDTENIYLKLEKEVSGLSASKLYNAVNIESGDLILIHAMTSCALVKTIQVRL